MLNWRELFEGIEEEGASTKNCNFDYNTEEAICAAKWMQAQEDFICPFRVQINNSGWFVFEWDIDIVWAGVYCSLLVAWIPIPGTIVFAAISKGNQPIMQVRNYR